MKLCHSSKCVGVNLDKWYACTMSYMCTNRRTVQSSKKELRTTSRLLQWKTRLVVHSLSSVIEWRNCAVRTWHSCAVFIMWQWVLGEEPPYAVTGMGWTCAWAFFFSLVYTEPCVKERHTSCQHLISANEGLEWCVFFFCLYFWDTLNFFFFYILTFLSKISPDVDLMLYIVLYSILYWDIYLLRCYFSQL